MTNKILSISLSGNPVAAPYGALEGEVLPPELLPEPSTRCLSKAIHALHDQGSRSGRPALRALALSAALELRALKSRTSNPSTPNERT